MRRLQTLAGMALSLVAGAVRADGVVETNYLHIDPDTAITVDGLFTKGSVSGEPHQFGPVQIGRGFGISPEGRLIIVSSRKAAEPGAIVLRFDEDICVIGVKVRIATGGPNNGIKVSFSFVADDGTLVDREIRFPALGTTLQSFSSDTYSDRFRGVKIAAGANSKLAIADIRALPCVQALS